MEFIKIAGTCVVVAVVIGVASATVSAATQPAPASPEMAVLTRQGISPARASQALSLQRQVAETHLAGRLAATLADAYAGVWFEPAAARLHIGVTSKASRQTAEQVVEQAGMTAAVTYTPVRSTWSALIATQNQWNARLKQLLAAGMATTGIDSPNNSVAVTLSSSVPLADRTRLEGEAVAAGVNVVVSVRSSSQPRRELQATCTEKFETKKAYCEKTLVAGVRIETPKSGCTAGPMLIEGNETYMLTAGHCFGGETAEEKFAALATNSDYPEKEPKAKEIGKEGTRFFNKERDTAEVKIAAGSEFRAALPNPVPALMTEWKENPKTPHIVEGIEKAEETVPKQVVCHEGQTSGENCGEVTKLNVSGVSTEHLVETNACAEAGDSGGPYFLRTEAGAILMVGTHVEGTPKCPQAGASTAFEPLIGLPELEKYGILPTFKEQEVLTTANEVRPGAPIVLPGTKENWTGESGKYTLETLSKSKVECEKSKAEGTIEETKPLGLFHITLESCKSSGVSCTGLGDKSGEILVLGTYHLVFDKLGALLSEAGVGILFLLEHVHFTCVIVLVLVLGEVLCLIKPVNSKTKHFEIKCDQKVGDPEETVYWNSKGAEVKLKEALLTSKDDKAYEGSGQSTTALILTTKEIELMT